MSCRVDLTMASYLSQISFLNSTSQTSLWSLFYFQYFFYFIRGRVQWINVRNKREKDDYFSHPLITARQQREGMLLTRKERVSPFYSFSFSPISTLWLSLWIVRIGLDDDEQPSCVVNFFFFLIRSGAVLSCQWRKDNNASSNNGVEEGLRM